MCSLADLAKINDILDEKDPKINVAVKFTFFSETLNVFKLNSPDQNLIMKRHLSRFNDFCVRS